MKIFSRCTGEIFPKKYEWGKEEYWKDRLCEIYRNHGVKALAPAEEIKMVLIGDPSYPANIIIMKDGTEFYDELNSPRWAFKENQKVFNNK
ncbi:hypothetical protein [Clostridium perfringens]|uniref:hypothetical protein n=1 Tax=Clostridium perfringens TaxID=1502 RepID=UPI0010EA768D|nr:hypothetical protein [Clostridium perfringens]VTQ55161.1 Uncharacterised protein [Clostridium perfringens]HAT4161034.1 hypothetical protein [Clostridium perfringens]